MTTSSGGERVDVEAVRARCEAATEGRWWAEEDLAYGGWDIVPLDRGGPHIALGDTGAVPLQADAEFIAHARTDVESLLAALAVAEQRADEAVRAADRLAGALAIALYDGHPVYGNTSGWRGGIGGSTVTQGCSLIDPPPRDQWMDASLDLLSTPLREWMQVHPVDLNAVKAEIKDAALAALSDPDTPKDMR